MILLAIRHLATLQNQQGILQGRADIPIDPTAVDYQVIQKNLDVIRAHQPEAAFSSPLQRTLQTATEYGYRESVIQDSRLHEFDFGEFEGRPKTELLGFRNGLWESQFTKVDLGESYLEFRSRIESFLNEHQSRSSVLIFSHGSVIRYLVCKSAGEDPNLANDHLIRNNELHILQFGL